MAAQLRQPQPEQLALELPVVLWPLVLALLLVLGLLLWVLEHLDGCLDLTKKVLSL